MVLIVFLLLSYVGILAAILWFVLSLIMTYFRYRRCLKETVEGVEETLPEPGVDLPVDDTLHSTEKGAQQ